MFLQEYVKPKKYFGQHFLIDENIAKKIVKTIEDVTKDEKVAIIEVGPGKGILSKYLCEIYQKENLYFIEIDKESVEYLKKKIPKISECLINADFLSYDFSNIKQEKIIVIGNFPYNISSQILLKIIEHRNRVIFVSGMFQREVAKRIVSQQGNKEYGILSVLLQTWYNCKYLFTVNEKCFYPPPKVKSGVIRIQRNDRQILSCDEKLFVEIVKKAFNQRRKTLKNSLKEYWNDNDLLKKYSNKRAEELSVSEYEEITCIIQKEL